MQAQVFTAVAAGWQGKSLGSLGAGVVDHRRIRRRRKLGLRGLDTGGAVYGLCVGV